MSKLILVGSASYEEKCAARIDDTRSSRLDETDRTKVASLMIILNNPAAKNKDLAFAQLGRILEKADAYDPILDEPHSIQCRFGIFQSVWKAAQELRRSGTLLELGKNIECPVVALHGDHDPHPAEGVEKPLSAVLKNFRFILLRNCGHKPWIERQAADKFYEILREELRSKG